MPRKVSTRPAASLPPSPAVDAAVGASPRAMAVAKAERVLIGLGSNLFDPVKQVTTALSELGELPETLLSRASSLYRSDPIGPAGQPDYINAVAALETRLAPESLLDHLQEIENLHGRVREVRWGPRTLDLDILLYGDQVIRTDRLSVPHPEIRFRGFVLFPLDELAPDLEIPGLGSINSLLATLPDPYPQRIEESPGGNA